MVRITCKNCGKLFEDLVGEHCESDENGHIQSYICPHCGKETILKY